MRKRGNLLHAEVRVCVWGGETEKLLNACAEAGLALHNICWGETGELYMTLSQEDCPRLEKIALLCMCELSDPISQGGSAERRVFLARSRLAALFAVFALALAASSLFIWDIEVVGNERLTEGEILRALSECGVAEGCFWPGSDVEELRSEMLLRLDELAWMTMNVHGSRARVLVLEREELPEIYDERSCADLVARCDGVITDYSVKNGQCLVARGQIVTEGELLVSGTMESLTGAPRMVRAEGSVSADTWREKTIVLEPGTRRKERKRLCRVILGLQVGKERINLLAKGRKDLDECDKIVKEYKAGVEGLFRFPLGLIVEIYRPYAPLGAAAPDYDAAEERALHALGGEIDGEIVTYRFERDGDTITLYAACRENIALVRDII